MQRTLPVLALLISSFAGWPVARLQAAEPAWHSTPQDAQKSAIQKDRPIVVFFKSTWCGYCKRMQQETWQNEAIQRKVDRHFIPLLVDADSHPELVERLQVQLFPTTMVFGPDGKLRQKVSGYQSTARIAALLDEAIPSSQKTARR